MRLSAYQIDRKHYLFDPLWMSLALLSKGRLVSRSVCPTSLFLSWEKSVPIFRGIASAMIRLRMSTITRSLFWMILNCSDICLQLAAVRWAGQGLCVLLLLVEHEH